MSLHSFNLSKTFPPCPIDSGKPLPFVIDEMDFSDWLNKLAKSSNELQKCRQLFDVLQTLNNSFPPERKLITGRTRLFFLQKIGSVLNISATLLTAFDNASVHPSTSSQIDDLDMAKFEIAVWSILELANAYSLLSQEDWFKADDYYSIQEKNLIIANGLSAMGRGLLFISQTYAKPYIYFWYKCFQFYRIARLYKLTDPTINPESHLIDNAFKRILIFSLSNTNQFTPLEMYTIYELLSHYASHAGLLHSVPKKKFRGIPSINLRGNGPPTIAEDHTDKEEDPDRLYIATVTVASKILEATYDRRAHHLPTDRLMLMRLAKTLTLNERRKDPRQPAKEEHLGIMGFELIVNYLRSKETDNEKIATLSSHPTHRPGEIRDLDFEISEVDHKDEENQEDKDSATTTPSKIPAQAFPVVEFTDPSDIWSESQRNTREINMRMLDKSAKGYGLLWTNNQIKPKVGSLIGILHKNLAVGLIRWLAQSKETGMFMGVELLGVNSSAVKISNPGFPDNWVYAIYLQSTETPNNPSVSLILRNDKNFTPSEFIFLHNNKKSYRYRITKQLHLTSFINHLEIVRSH